MRKPIVERIVYLGVVLLCAVVLALVVMSKFFTFDARLVYGGF